MTLVVPDDDNYYYYDYKAIPRIVREAELAIKNKNSPSIEISPHCALVDGVVLRIKLKEV